jgi:glycosyltransferase involved in cell wall biosynthesis
VLDGQTGFLFKPDSKEALIDSISKILNDRTLFYQMGSRARAVAKSRSWSGVLDHLIEDYASVISQHHYRLRKTNPAFAQQSTLVRRPFWMD